MTGHREREKKWQQAWAEQKAFEPAIDDRKKYFCTFPYPYANGLPHVGHLFSMMRVEAIARYKRSRGYNVLFPQGWHCTGSPIVNAAQRVAEGDQKQIDILKAYGIPEEEIKKFAEPEHWVEYFVPNYGQDIKDMGMSIDWRREFITTNMNPRYDAFIRWQFETLKEKGLVRKGRHPVVWDPKDQTAVSDHARMKGEGETPQEFLLIKFKLVGSDKYLVAATLRPETLPGATNLWLNPEVTYHEAVVDGETWIACEECLTKLEQQEHEVKRKDSVAGEHLVGQDVITPEGEHIPILPATFLTTEKGSGIVLSVPSDAPDDYIALRDLQKDEKQQSKYGVDAKPIKPIPIIDSAGLGKLAAVKVVDDMNIRHQKERGKLDEAKKLVYKKGFYEGTMLKGPFEGQPVKEAKEAMHAKLLEDEHAILFYELTGEVISRSLTKCIVKIVSDQWFLAYGDEAWKQQARDCLAQMKLYPEKSRQQFEYVLDWLRDWACTREKGLGTRLPWDERWLIESLSDSTLYNAFYTISHLLEDMPEEDVTSELFDYVFLGKGKPKRSWEPLREQFEYWYPVDYRNSGKDLIQNHLSFMIFHHVAFFGRENWPQAYGVNGMVTVDGEKMSKSLGNVIPARTLIEEYGADASRLTILNGGEGMDDPNWDSELAVSIRNKIYNHIGFCTEHFGEGRDERKPIDDWFASVVHRVIYEATEHMEQTLLRSAIQSIWFELSSAMKKYVHAGKPNKALMDFAIKAQLVMLQPFTPHVCEEIWSLLGQDGLISHAPWPQFDAESIDRAAEQSYTLIQDTIADVRNVLQMASIEDPDKVTVIVADRWKFTLVERLKELLDTTHDPKDIIQALMQTDLKDHGQQVVKLVPRFVKDRSKIPLFILSHDHERKALQDAQETMQSALGSQVEVLVESESGHDKARQALPGKPAIVVE